MGRTVLKPTLTDPDHQFIHCQAKFSTHLFGDEFEVRGMPFIQQDTQVGACAQASLWMVARYMSARFNLKEYFPGQINQMAKATFGLGRSMPAERGLNEWQMLDALQSMGFSAISYSRHDIEDCSPHIDDAFPVDESAPPQLKRDQQLQRNTAKLADIAYRYIESGLPVIFETHNHALVGIGHTYNSSLVAATAIQRIPSFYVNNDSAGPYQEMIIFSDKPGAKGLFFESIESIIAVLPPEVNLRGEEAEAMARTGFLKLLEEKINGKITVRDLLTKKLRPDLEEPFKQLEYRTYLMPSFEFQREIKDTVRKRRFNLRLGQMLQQLDYPKYVWVTEVSSSMLLKSPKRHQRSCLGRVIIDSTSPAKTRGELAIHCGDLFYLLDRSGKELGQKSRPWSIFPKSSPFPHRSMP
jgi:hypothetical protein